MAGLDGKRILITGGKGFLGRALVPLLEAAGAKEIVTFGRAECDLTQEVQVKRLFGAHPGLDVVIHAAADIGGIGYSSSHPATQFYRNTLINTYVLHHAWQAGVGKFVGVGSVCEYPAETPVPFREETLWDGYPVVSNDAYGLTKRMLLAQSVAYQRQYGFKAIHLLLINLYGPYDDFDLATSHVIPALIRKFHAAKESGAAGVEVWGTGKESREFLFVEDAARAIVAATQSYEKPDPVNIGTGEEVQIGELARLVAEITGYQGRIVFNPDKPGGQMRRMLDTTRAAKEFGFVSQVPFRIGLEKTYKYFLDNCGLLTQ